ncbi:hypothetical protein [Oceanobacillus massiliensis]|uniref:hypothetical protein n=1 Tax=Oceanobacillus massiliensis TaxID=1465765 RepID=UPI0002880BB8|nr:hypothetical protein [Oceanobacillus massiliensis]
MEFDKSQERENKATDSILRASIIILLIKITMEQFFFDPLPTIADNIFWVLLSAIFIIVFYIRKSYIYLSIMLVILLVGLFNL